MSICSSKAEPKWWYSLLQPFFYANSEIAITTFIPGLGTLYYNGDRAATSLAIGITEVVLNFLSFLTSGWLGRISDAVGRKGLLAVGVLANILPFAMVGFIGYKPEAFVAWMVINMSSGLFSTQKYTAAAYIADTSEEEKRPRRNVYSFAVIIVGGLFATAINLATGTQFEISRWFPVAYFCLAVLYFLIIPESLPVKDRIPLEEAKPYFNAIVHYKKLKIAPNGIVLTIIVAFASMIYKGFTAVWSVYTLFRYNADAGALQLAVLAAILGNLVFSFVVTPISLKFMSTRTYLIVLGAFNVLSFIIMLIAPNFVVYLVGILFFGPAMCVVPLVYGLISVEVSPKIQGMMVGTVAAVGDICGALGALVSTLVLTGTVNSYIDAFLVFLLIYAIAMLIAIVFFYKKPYVYKGDENEDSDDTPAQGKDVDNGSSSESDQVSNAVDI